MSLCNTSAVGLTDEVNSGAMDHGMAGSGHAKCRSTNEDWFRTATSLATSYQERLRENVPRSYNPSETAA
jgi:hypothetical protein